MLKHFGAEPLVTGATIGAQAFNRLVVLCAGKTLAARKLLEELSGAWRTTRLRKTKELPAEPVQARGILMLFGSASRLEAL